MCWKVLWGYELNLKDGVDKGLEYVAGLHDFSRRMWVCSRTGSYHGVPFFGVRSRECRALQLEAGNELEV